MTKRETIDELLDLKDFLSYDHIWKAIGPANRDRQLERLDKILEYVENDQA